MYILLLIWTIRLAGYLFITRVMKNYVDPRYQIISSKANSRIAYFFINYQGQAIITALITSVLYFVFRKPDYINPVTFSIGIVLIILGIIFESKCDKEYDSPDALITVTISGLTLEEYIRVRETYNREFHPDLYEPLDTSS